MTWTMPMRLALATALALCAPAAAIGQTTAGSPSVPTAPTPDKIGRPISRVTPSVTARTAESGSAPAAPRTKALPKAKALERAEKRKIDRDMDICTGC